MLAGLAKWKERRLWVDVPEAISEAKSDYQSDMDITGRWLAARTQKADPSVMISADDLYQDYHQYVRSIGHYPKSSTLWGREMKSRLDWKRDSKSIKYKGIIISEAEWPSTLPMEERV